ncbi:hypothetical protein [Roseibium sp. MMSF_3544]|uniref:hypothetical protein n=1 Tax=unclassified Roseibium TaxID=2629323 RepID=UPI00273D1FA7|nr:hypothetical protein [Roseibium sp. MMSF_3544]
MPSLEEQKRQHDFRQKLLYRVSKGDISPNDATALSIAKGCGDLLNRADRAKHDPMNSASWSITMTMAWIMFRDLEKVLLYSEGYRSEEEIWCSVNYFSKYDADQNFVPENPIHHKGYEPRRLDDLDDLGNMAAFTALELEAIEDIDEPEINQGELLFYGVGAAFEDIRESALNEELSVSALPVGSNVPVAIDAMDWSYFSIGSRQKDAALYRDNVDPIYEGVRLRRIDVMRLWPAFDPKTTPFPEEEVTLIQAVLCIARNIARNGEQLTDQQIVNRGLFAPCARLLFRILQKAEIATATGCRIENMEREPIKAEWGQAYEGDEFQDGNLIEWTDKRAFDGSGLGGKMTLEGQKEPTWCDIRVRFGISQNKKITAKKKGRKTRENPLIAAQHDWIRQELSDRSKWGDGQVYDSERELARVVSNRIEEKTGETVNVNTCRNHVLRISKELGLRD